MSDTHTELHMNFATLRKFRNMMNPDGAYVVNPEWPIVVNELVPDEHIVLIVVPNA